VAAQGSERCSICSFPEYPEIDKVTEGNVEVFVGPYVGVRSDNFLVITPLKGTEPQTSTVSILRSTT
jgi:hypothetical protein